MNMSLKLGIAAICSLLLAASLRADVVTQNFEAFPLNTTTPASNTTVNGWMINDTQIRNSLAGGVLPYSGTNMAVMLDGNFTGTSGTNTYVETPLLSNGVGSVSFYLRNWGTGVGPYVCQVRFSTNGTSWATAGAVTNTSTTNWTAYTVPVNIYAPVRLRLFKGGATTDRSVVVLEDISTTEAPAKVEISDTAISPASPLAGQAVNISSVLTSSGQVSNIVAQLRWSANGGSSNTISMATNSLSGGRYETITPITNQPAFTVINYTLAVTFSGPYASPTNTSGSFFYRQAPPQSAFTNLTVKGDFPFALDLVADRYWTGLTNVGAMVAKSVYFETVNAATNRWSDPGQTNSTLPIFGSVATNAPANIQIASTKAGWLLFNFNEQEQSYGVEQAIYQTFNSWTNAAAFTNYTIEGWTLTQGRATNTAALAFEGRSIQFASNTAERAIASPELTNGIGSILFRYRNTVTNGLSPAAFAIQTRATTTNTWQTVTTVTNILAPDYLFYRHTINQFGSKFVRVLATGPAGAQLLLDNIAVSTLQDPADVTIVSHGVEPAAPRAGETAVFATTLAATAPTLSTNATLYWAVSGGPSNTLNLAYNSGTGRYEGSFPTNNPELVNINYTLVVSFTGPHASFFSPKTATGSFFYRQAAPQSAFTNLTVKGDLTRALELVADDYWIVVTNVGARGATALYFETVNAATNQWRDPAQTRTSLPIFGPASTNTMTNIQIASIPAGGLLFSFDENIGRYGIQQATNQTFNTWSDVNFGTYTNAGWILTQGRIVTNAPFTFEGRSVQFASNTAERAIASPELTNGIGSILFRYRNTQTNLSPAAFAIQTRATTNDAWQTVQTVSDIRTPDYRFHSLTVANLDLRYIRIAATNGTAVAQLLIDDIIITRPGAVVKYEGLTHTPTNPTITNTVTVTVNITALNGAETNAPPTLWFRAGDSGTNDPISMINISGNTYSATIPRGAIGLMQYYIETTYLNPATGGSLTTKEPTDRTGMPAAYTNTDAVASTQNFAAFPLNTSNPPLNTTTNGWTINETQIRSSVPNLPNPPILPYSGTKLALLLDGTPSFNTSGTNAYVETPLLSNGVGSVSFYLNWWRGAGPHICEVRFSTNGTDWVTAASVTKTSTTNWTAYTVPLNIYAPVRLRLAKGGNVTADQSLLLLDGINVTYPPVQVTASGFELHPAYPSQEEPATIACTITSATTYHPAFNITGTLKYRSNNGVSGWTGWTSVPMTRNYSTMRFTGDIPPQLNLSEVEYYVESGFKGYNDGITGSDQSPMTFPESPLGYTLRRYISAYDRMNIRIGTNEITDFEQLGNGQWEGVITFLTPTNQPAFGIDGYGFYNGTNVLSGFTGTWGDNNQFRTNMPLAGTATIGALPIIIRDNAIGQYIVRFDENTGIYSVQRAAFQDFENWPADDTLFGESYAAATLTQHTNSFETWEPSNPNLTTANFEVVEGWTNAYAYPTNWVIAPDLKTTAVNHRYLIEGGIVVTQRVGQAALLREGGGEVRIQSIFPGDTGSFAFDLRCASPNDFRPAIHPAVTNTHMRIDASSFGAPEIPTNSSMNSVGYAYKSIIGNYIDANNYYEGRVVQINATQKQYQIWKRSGGVDIWRQSSALVTGNITDNETFRLMFFWTGTGPTSVSIRLQYGANVNVNYTDNPSLTPTYAFGLNGLDSSLSVEAVTVYAVTNSSFAINDTAIYAEDFTNSPPVGWDSSSGAWTASGSRYTRKGYTGLPITARVQFSTDQLSWETIDTWANLTHSNYRRYTAYPHKATNGYVKVENYLGDGYLIIDNVERVAWRGKTVSTNGWQATNVWVDAIGKTGRGIELRKSRALGGASQEIWTPATEDGVSVISFDYRPAPGATGPVAFAVEYEDRDFGIFVDPPLTAVTNATAPTNWVSFSYSIADRNLRPKIDRMRIRNLTPGHDDGLRIDNITVTEPVPINDTTWWGYNVLVTSLKPAGIYTNATTPWLARLADNTFGAFINNSSTNGTGGASYAEYIPFIQSAKLPDGIGEIRFLYRAWDTNTSQIQIVGTTSTNRYTTNEWTVLDTVIVNSTTYSEYYNAIFERDYRHVALRVNSLFGNLGRVGVENIMITAPLAADLRLSNLRTIPAVPLAGEGVQVEVTVDDLFFSPSAIELQLLHKMGTNAWGNHSGSIAYDMYVDQDNGTSFVFRSSNLIPQQAVDQVVQYQIKATFDGFFANKSSPKYYRNFVNPDHYWPVDLNRDKATNTPYYIVFSCLPGQVWINELNVADDRVLGGLLMPIGPQFVELVGVGNAGVGNWRIEVINPNFTTNSSYTIPGGTVIGSVTNSYGFYVLGDSTVGNRNLTLTSTLPDSAGIQLVRSMGAFEDQVSYDVDSVSFPRPGAAMTNLVHNQRYVYAGVEQTEMVSYSLSLAGSGSNSTDFAWSNAGDFLTIGTTNTGQTLIPWPTNDPPVGPNAYTGRVTIVSAAVSNQSGRVYFNANAEEANLMPSVWYVTNLLNVSSNDWRQRTTDFGYTAAGTNYQVWCNQVTPPVFYRIGMSVAP